MTGRIARLAVHIIVVAVFSCLVLQAQEPDTKAAQGSVETWLSLVDNRNYAASWESAASIFKGAVSQDKWQTAVQTVREPLGRLKSRKLKSALPTAAVPGAASGQYVVFQFAAAFEKQPAATETVTAMREADGTWRVGGYFIR